MSELKACGWCGSEAHRHSFLNDQIKCNNDKCPVSKSGFHRERVWNNRPAENKIKAEGVRDACGRIFPCNDEQEGYQQSLLEYAHNLENNDA